MVVMKRSQSKREDKRNGRKHAKKSQMASNSNEVEAVDSENKVDYGGLPDRDLKKNLGCG